MTLGRWRKSSSSNNSEGNCVEVALHSGQAGVRDSKNADGPRLAVDRLAWSAFVTAIKR
ncbi:protein of unknown function DUF397 [Alloactinosynnema sp. L-07]|uniref:DUF397 domain-containing protein n=1 Tax=Alloactinosynnema sp. L-07 TaxID=1653480 RepID=UPI00065F0B2E|nr:DUF397 domain-containing protein [Alloactinosynnema sp. L-07]CRK55073.1 protein of unknown function DUF397 [Alloactinosynnema sp. L-07]